MHPCVQRKRLNRALFQIYCKKIFVQRTVLCGEKVGFAVFFIGAQQVGNHPLSLCELADQVAIGIIKI